MILSYKDIFDKILQMLTCWLYKYTSHGMPTYYASRYTSHDMPTLQVDIDNAFNILQWDYII